MFKNLECFGKQKLKKQRISRRTNHTKEKKKINKLEEGNGKK
jgi:hypothetical protein